MALRYEWGWDAALTPFTISATDDGGSFSVAVTTGTYAHTVMTDLGYLALAAYLQTAINTASSSGTYTVTYNGTSGYTIAYSGSVLTLTFTGSTAITNAAKILGFSGTKSGSTSYSSDVRPYYVIIPAIQARSKVSDEYEPPNIVSEASADDGTVFQVAKDTSEIYLDWTQTAETQVAPTVHTTEGTPMHSRYATSEVPWTYQHAWAHMRGGQQPFACIESSTTLHEMRAEGLSFAPMRFAAEDYPLWSIAFKTRLIG